MRSQVIRAVLDEIFAQTEIDPAFIQPDANLMEELGMNQSQLMSLVRSSADRLKIAVQEPHEGLVTPRQIVEFIEQFVAHESSAA